MSNIFAKYRKELSGVKVVSSLICDAFGEVKPETLKLGQVTMTEMLEEDGLPF